MARQINDAGLELIKSFEALRLEAYLPTPDDVPTIGYGHTKGVQMGDTCTEEEAEAFLRADLAWAEAAVESATQVDLTDNEFAALVSITFNIGQTNFDRSTLLRELNQRDFVDASAQFLVWDRQRGVELPGLERRRKAEEALFDTEESQP